VSTEEEQEEKETKGTPWRKVILAIGVLGLIAAIIKGGFWLQYRFTHATTNDAFVDADLVNISPLVPGHIATMLVDEAQKVKKGQLLFTIDDRDYRARLAVAEAALQEARHLVQVKKATWEKAQKAWELTKKEVHQGIVQAKAQRDAALAKFTMAKNDFRRFQALYQRRVIGKRRFQEVETTFKEAKEALKARNAVYRHALAQRDRIALAKKTVQEAQKALEAAKATRKRAQREVEAAQIQLEHTLVKSPIMGIVAKKFMNPGDFVSPGYPVFSLYNQEEVYIIANLEETKAKGVRLEAPVDIWVDTYSGVKLKGKVVRIGEASAAKFALIPRDVTAGEFTKVVQRIPIKILFIDTKGKRLVPGMSVEVGIETK